MNPAALAVISASIERMNQTTRAYMEQINAINRQWASVTESTRLMSKRMLAMNQFTARLSRLLARVGRDFEAFGDISHRFSTILIERGWPPPVDIAVDEIPSAIRVYEEESPLEFDSYLEGRLLAIYYERTMRRKLSDWRAAPWLQPRFHILEAAASAHLREEYVLSIPAILPQIEGIIADGYAHRGIMTGPMMIQYTDSLFRADDLDSMDEMARVFITGTLLVTFKHGVRVASPLSRHAVLHGADVNYGTAANSLRAILLFDYLQYSMKVVSLEYGTKYHLVGCPRVIRGRSRRTFFDSTTKAEAVGKQDCKVCKPPAD